MTAGATYTPLATTTTSGSVANYTFTSISGAYTDLIIVVNGGASVVADVYVRLNGDTGSNYSSTLLSLDNLTVVSGRYSNATAMRLTDAGSLNNTLGATNQIFNIMNYANTTTYKSVMSRTNRATGGLDTFSGLWFSTSAITTVLLYPGSGTFLDGTTFTLYGIAAA